jgi:protocatechuate 3,4-dioxygenase beta subunit
VIVPDVTLPAPAFIHGRITTPGGTPVEGAELKLFRVATDDSLCTQVSNAPAACRIPATLLGRGASDSDGTVRFTLPR